MRRSRRFSNLRIIFPVFALALFLTGITALAEVPVIETDVSTPADDCVFMGIAGSFISNPDMVLNQINQYRLEACQQGVRNPNTNQSLTMDDYVPIRWSGDLEYIARIRAAESIVTMGHTRTSGRGIWDLVSPNNVGAFEESLAWNYTDSAIQGLHQWYMEKRDWVNQTEDAVTGHYTAMIDPTNLYVGVATFCSNGGTDFHNCTSAEFSPRTGLDETPISFSGECIQKLEIAKSHIITGNNAPQISGLLRGVKGDTVSLAFTTIVRFQKNGKTYNSRLSFLNPDWSSSASGIVSVDSSGTATANNCGRAQITASKGGVSASAYFYVDHIEVELPAVPETCTEPGLTAGRKCSACGTILNEQQTIPAIGHDWDAAVYSWSEDCTSVTASRTCKNKTEHVETETKQTTSEITKPATCTTKGETTYTAVFTGEGFAAQTKTIDDIPMIPHTPQTVAEIPATCTQTGLTEGEKCSVCGAILNDQQITPAIGHDWGDWTVTREATYDAEGEEQRVCGNDASHVEKRSVARLVKPEETTPGASSGGSPSTPSGSSSATPSGTSQTTPSGPTSAAPSGTSPAAPAGTISGSAGTTSAASGNTGSGTASSAETALTPETEINEAAAPAAAAQEKKILALKSDSDPKGSTYGLLQAAMKKAGKTSITLKWKKVKGAKSYIVFGNKCGKKNKYKKLKTVKGTSFTQKKLKKGTYYKYLVVAVKDGKAVATSKTIHTATTGGSVGNPKSVKVKKKTLKVAAGKTGKISASAVAASKKLKVKKHRANAFESSNTNIATVSKKGVVKGIRSGTCYVYAYAQNDVMAKVKVIVG